MSDNTDRPVTLEQTPNSDIVTVPGGSGDVQEGVAPLTPEQQVRQLSDFIENNYPELFRSCTIDEGLPYTSQGQAVPAALKETTERFWASIPDLLSHTSLLVLGAGLNHQMPHVSHLRTGPIAEELELDDLPEGIRATTLRPSKPTGAVAISLHGGPGWFGDGVSHDQLWLPLFAALAEASGVTVIDLIYPLPVETSWERTEQAVEQAFTVIGAHVRASSTAGESPALGLITFGTGFLAASTLANRADFHLALSPRIPDGLELDLGEVPTRVSLASLDSRGTPADDVISWMSHHAAEATVEQFPSEHLFAAPAVWRARVDSAAAWLSQF